MSYIDFRNNGAQLGFQNALNMGLQFGAQAAESANRKGFNNALAGYDPNNPDSFKEVAKYDARTAIALRRDAQAQEAAAKKQRQEEMGTFRKLLAQAAQSPEGWSQALGAAQQLGLDVSAVPQQYDPQWAQQQLYIMDALSDDETLTAIQKDIRSLDIDPNTPEGRKAVGELILYKYGKPTTDEYGRPALSLPEISVPGSPQQSVPVQQPARPEGMTDDDLFAQARAAVEAGANIEEVFRRLKSWGVEVQ